MLAVLLILSYIFGLTFVYGSLVLQLLRFSLRMQEQEDNPALILLTGLVAITSLAEIFSLFFPTGLLINLLLVLGAVAAVVARRSRWPKFSLSGLSLALFILAIFIILEAATHRPGNPDTNIYHAQAIHWIETYPAVPGLGNLHGRLAYNSTWLVTNALFSFAFLGGLSFHVAGAFIFSVFVLYCWPGLEEFCRGKFSLQALLKTVFIPLAFLLMLAEVSSPGTDLPATLLVWMLVIMWVEADPEDSLQPLLVALFSAFAFTLKLSAAPALLFGVLAFAEFIRKRSWRMLAAMAVGMFVVLVGYFAREVMLSGYLVYPFTTVDLFSLDWKIPLQRAAEERQTIETWARFPGLPSAKVLAMPLTTWLPRWIATQNINRKVLFSLAAASILSVPFFPRLIKSWQRSAGAWLVSYAGLWFWLFSAPDFRFGFSFLVPAASLAALPWLARLKPDTFFGFKPNLARFVPLGIIGIFLLLMMYWSVDRQSFASQLLLPADYDHVITQSCNLANGPVRCAKAYFACGYSAFPCIPGPRPWVSLRGPSLADGFRETP